MATKGPRRYPSDLSQNASGPSRPSRSARTAAQASQPTTTSTSTSTTSNPNPNQNPKRTSTTNDGSKASSRPSSRPSSSHAATATPAADGSNSKGRAGAKKSKSHGKLRHAASKPGLKQGKHNSRPDLAAVARQTPPPLPLGPSSSQPSAAGGSGSGLAQYSSLADLLQQAGYEHTRVLTPDAERRRRIRQTLDDEEDDSVRASPSASRIGSSHLHFAGPGPSSLGPGKSTVSHVTQANGPVRSSSSVLRSVALQDASLLLNSVPGQAGAVAGEDKEWWGNSLAALALARKAKAGNAAAAGPAIGPSASTSSNLVRDPTHQGIIRGGVRKAKSNWELDRTVPSSSVAEEPLPPRPRVPSNIPYASLATTIEAKYNTTYTAQPMTKASTRPLDSSAPPFVPAAYAATDAQTAMGMQIPEFTPQQQAQESTPRPPLKSKISLSSLNPAARPFEPGMQSPSIPESESFPAFESSVVSAAIAPEFEPVVKIEREKEAELPISPAEQSDDSSRSSPISSDEDVVIKMEPEDPAVAYGMGFGFGFGYSPLPEDYEAQRDEDEAFSLGSRSTSRSTSESITRERLGKVSDEDSWAAMTEAEMQGDAVLGFENPGLGFGSTLGERGGMIDATGGAGARVLASAIEYSEDLDLLDSPVSPATPVHDLDLESDPLTADLAASMAGARTYVTPTDEVYYPPSVEDEGVYDDAGYTYDEYHSASTIDHNLDNDAVDGLGDHAAVQVHTISAKEEHQSALGELRKLAGVAPGGTGAGKRTSLRQARSTPALQREAGQATWYGSLRSAVLGPTPTPAASGAVYTPHHAQPGYDAIGAGGFVGPSTRMAPSPITIPGNSTTTTVPLSAPRAPSKPAPIRLSPATTASPALVTSSPVICDSISTDAEDLPPIPTSTARSASTSGGKTPLGSLALRAKSSLAALRQAVWDATAWQTAPGVQQSGEESGQGEDASPTLSPRLDWGAQGEMFAGWNWGERPKPIWKPASTSVSASSSSGSTTTEVTTNPDPTLAQAGAEQPSSGEGGMNRVVSDIDYSKSFFYKPATPPRRPVTPPSAEAMISMHEACPVNPVSAPMCDTTSIASSVSSGTSTSTSSSTSSTSTFGMKKQRSIKSLRAALLIPVAPPPVPRVPSRYLTTRDCSSSGLTTPPLSASAFADPPALAILSPQAWAEGRPARPLVLEGEEWDARDGSNPGDWGAPTMRAAQGAAGPGKKGKKAGKGVGKRGKSRSKENIRD